MTKHGGELGRASVKVKAIEGAGWGGTVSNSGPPLTPSGPFRSNMMREKKPECTLEIVLKRQFQRGPARGAGPNAYFIRAKAPYAPLLCWLALRWSVCSSNRRRLASSNQSILCASSVPTPAALKRTTRPFWRCTNRRASATYSSAWRMSSSKLIAGRALSWAIAAFLGPGHHWCPFDA